MCATIQQAEDAREHPMASVKSKSNFYAVAETGALLARAAVVARY